MKKTFLSFLLIAAISGSALAQSPAGVVTKHSRDFLVASLTWDTWTGAPDSIKTGGLSYGFNVSFTYDFPLKEESHFSVAPGLGISASHMSFKDQIADISGNAPTLNFYPDSLYKNFQLINTYLEIPVELRYRTYGTNANKGFKAAIGLKFGTLLNVHSKGKQKVRGTKQSIKVKNRQYFSNWRAAGTLRIGYGHFAAFASYSLTTLLKPNAGPKIRPLSVGIAVSGF